MTQQVPLPELPSHRLRCQIEARFGSLSAWESSRRRSCRDCLARGSFLIYQGCNAGCGEESHRAKILQYYAESEQKRLAVHLQQMTVKSVDKVNRTYLVSHEESHRVARRVLREVFETHSNASSFLQILSISLVYYLARTYHDVPTERGLHFPAAI